MNSLLIEERLFIYLLSKLIVCQLCFRLCVDRSLLYFPSKKRLRFNQNNANIVGIARDKAMYLLSLSVPQNLVQITLITL